MAKPIEGSKAKNPARGLILFGSAWLLFGLPCLGARLGVGFQEMPEGMQFREHGLTAQGIVLEKQRGFNTGRSSAGPVITYRFATSSGREIEHWATLEREAWSRLRKGGPVSVVYLPDSPDVHRVEGQESNTFLAVLFSFFGLVFTGIGGGVIAFNLRSRAHRRRR